MPYRVCFVCTGNICRSPMAESVFRARVAEAGLDGLVEVDSAGTGGWHEGDGADPRTVSVLEANGYDSDHAARQFQAAWFARLDLVIALDEGHLRGPAPPRADRRRTRRRCGCCARTTPPRPRRPRRSGPVLRGHGRLRGVPGDGGGGERGPARRGTASSRGTGGMSTDTGAASAGDGTRAVRAGLPEPVKYEPTLPGPVFAAHFHLPGEPTGPYTYGRDENPTWTHLERAIGELEAPGQDGVETVVFASGMAAISAVLFSQLRAGDTVVLPDDGYQALPLVREQLEAYGIEVRTAPTGGDAQLVRPRRGAAAVDRDPVQPGARRVRRAAARRGGARGRRAGRRRQHPRDPARAAPAGAGRRLLGGQRHQGLTGHGDILLGHVTCRDAAAGGRRTALAQDRRGDPGADGGLARAPLAGHAPAARRPAVRQRAGARRGAERARTR